jgi:hypothetical protein
MTNLIVRSSFQSDMKPIIKKWFGETYKNHDPLYSKIYQVMSSSDAFETDALVLGMGTLVVKPEGQALSYDTSKQQWTPRYSHTTYALGYKISKEMISDGKAFKNAEKYTKMLKKAAMETRDIAAASVINLGHTSGNTMDGGDGVILFSASHPTMSGNQSNVISSNADLNEAAIESLYVQIRKAKDDRGIRINLLPQKLLVSVDDYPTACRVLKSDKRSGTPDNDINFVSGMFPGGIVDSPYFTDTDSFTIITNCEDGLKWYNRQDPQIDSDNEFDTKNACYSVDMRFSNGWSNWRGAYSSPGV